MPTVFSWRRAIFAGQNNCKNQTLIIKSRTLSLEFLKELSTHSPTVAQIMQADQWYESKEGQETLVAIIEKAWYWMSGYSSWAMPGHDARHSMFKVPASAICHLFAEGVQGYARVGALSALLHDWGRWAQERLMGAPAPGPLHARLSFVLAKELIASYAMPDLVRQGILEGVLRHTSGATTYDPMPLKLTVSADRDQLYGPEIIIRLAHGAITLSGEGSSFYGEKPGTSILNKIHHLFVNQFQGPLFARQNINELKEISGVFLMICETKEYSYARWVKGFSENKADLAADVWLRKWEYAQVLGLKAQVSKNVHEALERLLNCSHIAPGNRYMLAARNKLSDISLLHEPYLLCALDWATQERNRMDAKENLELTRLRDDISCDLFLNYLLGKILNTKDHSYD